MKHITHQDGWRRRIERWFPDREFFMRSRGSVRFIKISSTVQFWAAAAVAAVLVIWVVSLSVMGWLQYRSEADRASLLEREARIATHEERIEEYSTEIDAVAADLRKRQDYIEAVTQAIPDDIKRRGTVSDSSAETEKTVDKVSTLIPEAAELARIEARQIAFVERMTRFADMRAARAAAALRQLGLNPAEVIQTSSNQAKGGPLEVLATKAKGRNIDPRFERLGLSIARMTALERGLAGIPQVNPASIAAISSGFGYRRDPFTGGGAMHSGLDFKGPTGAPVHAAADGVVSKVGWQSGYGKTVEIAHGNGLMTRYAHMSRWKVSEGQKVRAGAIVGAIGSTGRSTGPHLHFEVRIHNRAVNPRPFLEKARRVLKEARATESRRNRPERR